MKYGWMARRRDRHALLVLLACDALRTTSRGASGYTLHATLGRGVGGIYVVLARLEGAGFLSSGWETPDPLPDGRPRRRLYFVTDKGRSHITSLTERLVGSNQS